MTRKDRPLPDNLARLLFFFPELEVFAQALDPGGDGELATMMDEGAGELVGANRP